MMKHWFSKEKRDTIVGADFGDARAAQSAADALRSERTLEGSGLHVIRPQDPEIDRKLEPESRAIAGTLVRAHVVLGIIGLASGLVLSIVLVALGIPPLAASPVLSISVITVFATIAGLLAGGLVSLRPDHDPIIHRARSMARSGRWFVVVHTREPSQRECAESILERFSDDTIRTI